MLIKGMLCSQLEMKPHKLSCERKNDQDRSLERKHMVNITDLDPWHTLKQIERLSMK